MDGVAAKAIRDATSMSTDHKITQHYNFSFLQKENLACAKRKTKITFLVKVFTEGKKVVGNVFACKKVCVNLVKSRGFLPLLYKY